MQQLIILLIFALAMAYLGRRAYRSLARKQAAGCGKNCGCAADKKKIVVQKAESL